MKDRSLFWGSVVMLVAVAMGAFGAHGLEPKLTDDALMQWDKGVLYQLVHGLALVALAAVGERITSRLRRLARTFFVVGIICFSGSLYLLATRDLLGIHGFTRAFGPITPLGGLSLMAGWLTLGISALRAR